MTSHKEAAHDTSCSTYDFPQMGEQEFLGKVEFGDLESIEVIAHTGQTVFANLIQALDQYGDTIDRLEAVKKVAIRILLRHPDYETSKRRDAILETVRKIAEGKVRGYNIEVHFYQPLPTLRAIICTARKTEAASPSSFLSFYWFPEAHKQSKSCRNAFINDQSGGKQASEQPASLLRIFRTWFDNFWGPSKTTYQHTHTIVFDFDDTIANSHKIQIDAWVSTLLEAQERFNVEPSQFHGDVQPLMTTPKDDVSADVDSALNEHVKRVFFEEQDAKKIIDKLFSDLSESQKKDIEEFRLAQRRTRFFEAPLFEGVEEMIDKLSETHQLAVISATDENDIDKYLKQIEFRNHPLRDRFKYVFGKHEHGFNWGSLSQKAQLLLKTLGILGVPASRITFVGDNNRDYEAASQVGIDFIEARLFAKEVNQCTKRSSLISSGKSLFHFDRWNEFDVALGKVDHEKSRRIMPTDAATIDPRADFHVFLCHNDQDKLAVRELKQLLVKHKIKAWLDEDELQPGIPWQQRLEDGIKNSASVAVLVGKDGLGQWAREEMDLALRLAVEDKRTVFAVLMPGAPAQPKLPEFLRSRTFVDLRGGLKDDDDKLNRLIWGITGKKANA